MKFVAEKCVYKHKLVIIRVVWGKHEPTKKLDQSNGSNGRVEKAPLVKFSA